MNPSKRDYFATEEDVVKHFKRLPKKKSILTKVCSISESLEETLRTINQNMQISDYGVIRR